MEHGAWRWIRRGVCPLALWVPRVVGREHVDSLGGWFGVLETGTTVLKQRTVPAALAGGLAAGGKVCAARSLPVGAARTAWAVPALMVKHAATVGASKRESTTAAGNTHDSQQTREIPLKQTGGKAAAAAAAPLSAGEKAEKKKSD